MKNLKPFTRKKLQERKIKNIAYDLETTNIKEGTPRPLYITAFSDDFKISHVLNSVDDLRSILIDEFLIEENLKTRFVAWNGNHFDAYFIGLALIDAVDKNNKPLFIIKPHLTKSKSLRGITILDSKNSKRSWTFLDGIAMTGALGKPLSEFVKMFAPNFPKLKSIDFNAGEVFDANNKNHVAYAERDSEALYYALKNADDILRDTIGHGLTGTIGNLGIKFFRSKIPYNIAILPLSDDFSDIVRDTVFRGGYVWTTKQYEGPIWKYDINQAYAAAMRETKLPCGYHFLTKDFDPDLPGIYKIRFSKDIPSPLPFYYKSTLSKNEALFTLGNFEDETWITSTELQQLYDENWNIKILAGLAWAESFKMQEMVDDLEFIRLSDKNGTNGPLGTMIKYLGNSTYGKTVEKLGEFDLVMCRDQPPGYLPLEEETPELDFIFIKNSDENKINKDYHKPQIGAFITAYVRMLIRKGALHSHEDFLAADTDCLMFSSPQSHLKIDKGIYGYWKVEAEGVNHIIKGKKVYCDTENKKVHVKGLHIKTNNKPGIDVDDFKNWGDIPPEQTQIQRQSFIKTMAGSKMFVERSRKGTDFANLKNITLTSDRRFIPKIKDSK